MAVTKRTRRQIKEALAYWKKQLRKLNEGLYNEDGEGNGSGADNNGGGGDGAGRGESSGEDNSDPDGDDDDNGNDPEEKPAKDPDPFAKFNPMKRIVRLHNAAVKKVSKLVSDKFLNKWKAGDAESISIENSAIDTDEQTFDYEKGEKMVITMTVSIDKAKVKGFRKMLAVILKESTFKKLDYMSKRLNEGLFDIIKGAFRGAIKGGAKEGGEAKKAAIDQANKELKERIGVFGLHEYVRRVCGADIANKLKPKHIEIGFDKPDPDEALSYVYKAIVTFS